MKLCWGCLLIACAELHRVEGLSRVAKPRVALPANCGERSKDHDDRRRRRRRRCHSYGNKRAHTHTLHTVMMAIITFSMCWPGLAAMFSRGGKEQKNEHRVDPHLMH